MLSGRALLPSPTAWSPDHHHAAMLSDVSRHILDRTEGRGLGFVYSNREVSEMPIVFRCALRPQSPVSRRNITVCWARSSLQIGSRCGWYPPFSFFQSPLNQEWRSGEVSWPLCRCQVSVSAEPDCRLLQVCLLFHCLLVPHEQAPTGRILNAELSA